MVYFVLLGRKIIHLTKRWECLTKRIGWEVTVLIRVFHAILGRVDMSSIIIYNQTNNLLS